MRFSRTLNTGLLLLALAVMMQRIVTPFMVPVLVVHENGYIEICSWHGGSERILLDADGQPISSEQPFSYCPECASPSGLLLAITPALTEPFWLALGSVLLPSAAHPPMAYLALPPPSRAPPIWS